MLEKRDLEHAQTTHYLCSGEGIFHVLGATLALDVGVRGDDMYRPGAALAQVMRGLLPVG